MLFPLLFLFVCAGFAEAASYSVETLPLSNGSDLVTIFQRDQSTQTPLLSMVRDTLGDANPENDRLSYLWLLNSSRPAWWQRVAAAMPFFYGRAAGKRLDGLPPRPLIDVAARHPGVFGDLGLAALQVWTFDPAGMALRASTRAYQGNAQNERKSRFEQAFTVISAFEEQPESSRIFTSEELERLRSRLILGQRRLGGLVSEDRFAQVSANQLRESEETRGRNWEILRQAAESNGLWFEPIALGRTEANYALISIRAGDSDPGRPFDPQFLRIRDPWTDDRLRKWSGYTRGETIPLALYDLEHPRTPLLLVDFRDNRRPKRREIFQRASTDLMKSVFGLSYLRNWYYFAPRGAHNLVEGRRGVALDPLDRLRAYAKLKLQLGLDRSLDDSLREELRKQLSHLALNPLESDFAGESSVAEQHYALLTKYAKDPKGLPRKLNHDRSAELARARHSKGSRALLRLSTIASFGIYRHREQIDSDALLALDLTRQTAYHERFLRQAMSSPRIEVDFDPAKVRQSLEFLAKRQSPRIDLFEAILARTGDEELRRICLAPLRQQNEAVLARRKGAPASLGAASGAAFLLSPR